MIAEKIKMSFMKNIDFTNKIAFSDVSFSCTDTIILYSSRCVLSARSEYFEKLFTTGYKDSKEMVLDCGYSSDVMKIILEFIFSGNINISAYDLSKLPELLDATCIYGVNELKYAIDKKISSMDPSQYYSPEWLTIISRYELHETEKKIKVYGNNHYKSLLTNLDIQTISPHAISISCSQWTPYLSLLEKWIMGPGNINILTEAIQNMPINNLSPRHLPKLSALLKNSKDDTFVRKLFDTCLQKKDDKS